MSRRVLVRVKRIDSEVPIPSYAHEGDAGLDLCSAESVIIAPGERALVRTGIEIAIPAGFAGFVQPRSGLAIKQGLGLLNSPGLIDSGYRGEVKVILINLDPKEKIEINKGDRVAQLVIMPVPRVDVIEVSDLPASTRGTGGFGSTGK